MSEYRKPPPKKGAKVKDPVYIATGSFVYRFHDGTHLRLRRGVAVTDVGPGHIRELKKHGYIKEVR